MHTMTISTILNKKFARTAKQICSVCGLVFLVSLALMAFSCQTGKDSVANSSGENAIWQWDSKQDLADVIGISDGKLYGKAGRYLEFGSPNHILFCLDAKTGKVLWQTDIGKNEIMQRTVLAKGFLYAESISEKKWFFDALTGKKIRPNTNHWRLLAHAAKQRKEKKPLQVESKDDTLVFLSQTGKKLWQKKENPAQKIRITATEMCYALQKPRQIRCRDKQTGRLQYRLDVRKIPNVQYPDKIDFSFLAQSGWIYIGHYDGKVEAYKTQ